MLRNTLMSLILTMACGAAWADPGMDAVKALGRLNGEALACKQMALVDRIRTRIIYEAPKTREIGETFEAATSARYLEMGASQAACQDSRAIAEQIETATQALRTAFAEAMGRKQ